MDERLSSPTFAGREPELDRLCSTLVALDTTGARTVLVGGEAGIGKTRLVDEFRGRARAAGALVASGVCTPAEGGGLPYGPVVGVLRDLSRRLDERTAAAILTPARRGLGLLDAPAAHAAADAANEMGKTRLFEALLTCSTALAERSRVVIVFEDLQWADSASVEVIDFLARNLGESPLLLIGTYRGDEVSHNQLLRRTLAELGRHNAVSQLKAEATLASRGGRPRAIEAAQAAWRTAMEVGAMPLQARVERFAQRARITLVANDPDSSDSLRRTVAEDLALTAREVEVLTQLALGRTDRQIADDLSISKKTASVHVSNILRKLDAGSRFDAAEIGQRAGLG